MTDQAVHVVMVPVRQRDGWPQHLVARFYAWQIDTLSNYLGSRADNPHDPMSFSAANELMARARLGLAQQTERSK